MLLHLNLQMRRIGGWTLIDVHAGEILVRRMLRDKECFG